MHGDTDKEAQVWRGSLVSLSFQPRSSLRGCLCFSLSHRRRSQSCSYLHYALHCSHVVHECGMAAWQRGHVQRFSITWMGRTRSVGRSVDARAPVDHDSVGLAQARPNYALRITSLAWTASATKLGNFCDDVRTLFSQQPFNIFPWDFFWDEVLGLGNGLVQVALWYLTQNWHNIPKHVTFSGRAWETMFTNDVRTAVRNDCEV